MEEIWRDIKDYEGLYMVSNLGRVMNINTGHILKPVLQNTGYYVVTLCKNKCHKIHRIHRLVGMTFPDLVQWDEEVKNKPFSEIVIDHKNRIKTDNRVENLKWCTMGGNMNNPLTKQVCSEYQKGEKAYWYGKTGKKNPNSKPILQFDLDGNYIREWNCMSDIYRELGISIGCICLVCQGKRKSAGGFKWSYA